MAAAAATTTATATATATATTNNHTIYVINDKCTFLPSEMLESFPFDTIHILNK